MLGFSWSVILTAVAIVAIAVYIFDIDWYKAALVVVAILFVSGLYRDGKLPEFLEPIADKVFFWVDKEAEETKESEESQEIKDSKEADKSLFSQIKEILRSILVIRVFGIRIVTIIFILSIAWWFHHFAHWGFGKVSLVVIALFVVAFLYTRDKLPEAVEPIAGRVFKNEFNVDIEDTFRPSYNKGTCYDLSGSPYVLSIYIDDDESAWTPEAAAEFQQNIVLPGLKFINEQAAEWGVSLELSGGMIVSDASKDISVRYNGTILPYLDGGAIPQETILKQVVRSLGFLSAKDFYRHMQEETGEEQVAIMLIVNKDGRSHAGTDIKEDDGDDIECYVVYSSLNGNKTCYGVVAHELLHSFGAEDLYEEESTGERAGRAAIAEKYYPNDIMLNGWTGTEIISAYTAYAVGWTHDLPEECIVSEFWEGHWSRE